MNIPQDIAHIRRIYTALTLHYVDGLSQAEIASRTGHSHSTINRMIRSGHAMGMVEIVIRSPFQDHLALERELMEVSNLREVVIDATISDNPEVVLARVGMTAAELLVSKLRPDMSVCLTGGRGVSACVAGLRGVGHIKGIKFVPATGLVQGKHYTDVNHAAATMARAFGGEAAQMLSPMFAETREQREMITGMKTVSRVLQAEEGELLQSGAMAELLAHVLDATGRVTDYNRNGLVVALSPEELAKIPISIGVAALRRGRKRPRRSVR